MAEWAIAPARCIIADEAVGETGRIAKELARDAVIVGGRTGLSRVLDPIRKALDEAGVPCRDVLPFAGECAPKDVERIAARLRPSSVAIAVGGGKAIDTAKAAARSIGCPVISVPTSAATCAAATALVVMHTEDGAYDVGKMCYPGPEALILDIGVVRSAPKRLLAAGLADAWARTRETELAARVGLPTALSICSAGVARAYGASLIEREGSAALDQCEAATSDAIFERVATACIVGAGVASGLCGGFYLLNIAHSIDYGLTHVLESGELLHGEGVGLGLLVQAWIDDPTGGTAGHVRSKLDAWGAPTSLSGVSSWRVSSAQELARRAYGYLDHEHGVPFAVTAEGLIEAIERVAAA